MHYPHPLEIAARKKRNACIIATILLALAGLIYSIWPTGPYGPTYEGRPLTAWLEDFTNPLRSLPKLRRLGTAGFMQSFNDSRTAVKAIGTNAVPTLLQLLQAKDSLPRALCLGVIDGPQSQQNYFISARHKRKLAYAGFMILNTNAITAGPELMKLTGSEDGDVRGQSFKILLIVESRNLKSLLPVVVQLSRDPEATNRELATRYLHLILGTVSTEDAKAAGVYEAFPEYATAPPETH